MRCFASLWRDAATTACCLWRAVPIRQPLGEHKAGIRRSVGTDDPEARPEDRD